MKYVYMLATLSNYLMSIMSFVNGQKELGLLYFIVGILLHKDVK
jgi:hypothetical protein